MTQAMINGQAVEIIKSEGWGKLSLDTRIDFLFAIEGDVDSSFNAIIKVKNLLRESA